MSVAFKRSTLQLTLSNINAGLGVLDQKTFESLSQKIYHEAGIVLPYKKKMLPSLITDCQGLCVSLN